MSKEQIVSAESFHRWKKDPVTIEIMKYFSNIRKNIEMDMLDPLIVLGENGLQKYSKSVGMRDGVDRLLNLHIDDIIEDDNE